MKLSDREKQIAVAILDGGTFEAVGKDHDITRERARQLFFRAIKAVAPEMAENYRGAGPGLRSGEIRPVDRLRESRDDLVAKINAYNGDPQWGDLPIRVVNALRCIGIESREAAKSAVESGRLDPGRNDTPNYGQSSHAALLKWLGIDAKGQQVPNLYLAEVFRETARGDRPIRLTRREALVLMHVHQEGIGETARRFDVTRERVRQVLDKALRQIRLQTKEAGQ